MPKTQMITVEQAYLAMYEFLVELYNRTGSDEVGAILGSMSYLADDKPADPAIWNDWMNCIHKATSGTVGIYLDLSPLSPEK